MNELGRVYGAYAQHDMYSVMEGAFTIYFTKSQKIHSLEYWF